MPMLAERRRKTISILNTGRRPLWNNDDSRGIKFGQGLMEKLGWKVGQGLGSNKQGITEPLTISMKNDCKGIGFKDTDSIEWVQQQHDFNELLGKLSASNKTTENNECRDAKAVKIRTSLEEKSKHSKTRVHYHKFTRGKDLSKYSEKDLECIVGSKKELIDHVVDEKDSRDSCSKPETDQSMTHAGSMVDYFSQKIRTKQNDRHNKLTECRDKEHLFKNFHGNENEKSEGTSSVKEKRQKVKEIKRCNGLLDSTCSSKYFENHSPGDTVTDSNATYDDKEQETNHRNKCLTVVSSEDCLQEDLNDGRGEEGEEKIKDICDENISGDKSEYKHLKKHKKKRKQRETEENNLESVEKLENSVIDCKKRKFDEKEGVEIEETIDSKKRKVDSKNDEICTEEISKPRKKKKRKEKVEEANLHVDRLESEEVSHSKKKKMDDGDEHFEHVSREQEKGSGKENAKKTQINLGCDSQLEIEEWKHCKSKKIKKQKDEGNIENVEEVLKPRKKERRKEKIKEIEKNPGVDPLDTEEVSRSKRKKVDENVEHSEEVSRQRKKEKTEKNVACDSQLENDVEHCQRKNKGVGSIENFEEMLKQQKKEKRKEKRKEIENADVCDERIHAESHGKKSKKKKRSREEENSIEGDEIKQGDPHCNTTNVDPGKEENVPWRQGKGSNTNDTTVAYDIKENKRKSEKDECNNNKGKKENYKNKKLKPGDSDPYETLLLGKGSAYAGKTQSKILDLICNTNAFRGSNLKHLQGYGIIRYITNDNISK